jgi:hypothetical protein
MTIHLPFRSFLLTVLAVVALPVASAAQFTATNYYHIKPRHALQAGYNLCLDVENVSPYDNARIQQYTCNTAAPQENQMWSLMPAGTGIYRLVPAVSAKCLDVLNPQNGSGAVFQQYACNLQALQTNQVFNVTPAPTAGYYRISSTYSSGTQCLDVPFSSLTAGQDVQQWACGPWWQDNQDWQIVATPWARSPVGHVKYFGWYGEGNIYNPASAADDHANMIVYTASSLPLINSRPAHISAKLALNELVVYAPKNVDLIANNGTDGGLVNNICTVWANMRSPIAGYMSRVKAFYIDEPILNLAGNGFTVAEAQTIIQTVTQVVKGGYCPGGPADPTVAFAVVEGWPYAHVQQPTGVDWVGFDCYDCEGPSPNYVNLWNAQRAALMAHQKLVSVPPARVDKTPIQAPCDIQTAINSVTPGQASTEAGRAHFYLTLALAEPKVVAVWPWHGPSRYFFYTPPNPCDRQGIIVGGHDIPVVKDTWRFLARTIGFGNP